MQTSFRTFKLSKMYGSRNCILIILVCVITGFSFQLKAQSLYSKNYKGHLILCGGVSFPEEAIKKFVFLSLQRLPVSGWTMDTFMKFQRTKPIARFF